MFCNFSRSRSCVRHRSNGLPIRWMYKKRKKNVKTCFVLSVSIYYTKVGNIFRIISFDLAVTIGIFISTKWQLTGQIKSNKTEQNPKKYIKFECGIFCIPSTKPSITRHKSKYFAFKCKLLHLNNFSLESVTFFLSLLP